MKPIEKLSEKDFAAVFQDLREKVLEDPIKYFVEAEGFIDFNPTPAQRVALKIVFSQPLDENIKFPVNFEKQTPDETFRLETIQMSEVEIYEYMTGKEYVPGIEAQITDVDLIIGRRGGKCLAQGTEVLTPNGPKRIEDIKVGDTVYGYDSDGKVRETPVLDTHVNGEKEVFEIVSDGKVIAESTKEHVWLAKNRNKISEKKLQDFWVKDQQIVRNFIDIPCGDIDEKYAYTLGVLLGDGCSTCFRGPNDIWISSENEKIPNKIMEEIDGERLKKNSGNNYTWIIYKQNHNIPFYNKWCKGKKAHEKIVDLEVIDNWNRESCLRFLAGLIDTDGSVYLRKDSKSLNVELCSQSKSIIEAFQYLIYKLFQVKIKITEDNRKKYKNGKVYRARISKNVYTKRIIKQLSPFIQTKRKKWKSEYENLSNRNWKEDCIGIKVGNSRKIQTYDLSIGNDTNLYLLANEGLVTHNSTIASILALFGVIKENWKPMLHKTPHATVLILSHTKEFSQEILEILRDMVMASPILSRLMNKKKKNTQYTFNMQVPFFKEKAGETIIEYSKVQIAVGAASKKTTRGKAICFSLNDEIAYWGTDEKYAETDEDIIQAIRPSLGQFNEKGMMIKLSSPGIKQGLLYNEYQNREELPDSFVVFKAPSWFWNNIIKSKFYETEYLLDPNGFATEYRADFVDSLSDFIMSDMVDSCVIKGSSIRAPEAKGEDVTYVASIDAAFKGDRFTFSIVGYHEGRFKQYVMMAWEGSRKKPVSAHTIAKFIRTVANDYHISEINADQYAFQPLKEIFEQYGLVLKETPFTNKFKKQIYYNLKTLIHNQKIDLLDNAQCLKEIKQLQVEQTSTGTVRIGHPPGGHDDCADVVAICSYLLAYGLHRAGMDIGEVAGTNYDIKTDKDGKTFGQAPSAEMLSDAYNYEIFDNSDLWTKHPETGKWVKKSELEEENDPDGARDMGGDFIFC